MKKLGIVICLLFSIMVFSQVDASRNMKEKGRWVFGGGISLGFNNGFNIQLNPDIGYRINKLEFGASVGLSYANFESRYYENYKYTLWNFGPYLLYMPVRQFYLRAQYQYYTGGVDYENAGFADVNWDENTLWLGGGFQNQLAPHVYYRIGLLYNVLYDENESIFPSGFIPTFGVSVGM